MASKRETFTPKGITQDLERLAQAIDWRGWRAICPIPRGGWPVAAYLAGHRWQKDPLSIITLEQARGQRGVLYVDDLIDSGRTALALLTAGHKEIGRSLAVLYAKTENPDNAGGWAVNPAFIGRFIPADQWVTFPWETDAPASDGVTRLLQLIGEDPTRQGLLETPRRVSESLREMTTPEPFNWTTFDAEGADEMVSVQGIPFSALCEHHLLPFTGTAAVAYLPSTKLVGLSKLARVVRFHARNKLQTQERITQAIATDIMRELEPLGCGVQLRAEHMCMTMRGVQAAGTLTTTTAVRGAMLDKPEARAEFLRAVGG